MSFFRRLSNRVSEIDSLLCVGLDPHVNELQNKTAEGAFTFCQEIISATSTVAAAYKPNAAFFEAFGSEGVAALKRVIEIIPDDIPILLDAKRGDISTTAEAYAAAAFTELGADAITLSPYMGFDSIQPFLTEGHGCFVLCKTSNPTSNDFQTLPLARKRRKLFEEVAWLASKQWNSADNVGLVVGATDVHALAAVRKVAPSIWILAPGIGAQGGDLQQACFSGLTDEGTGLLIPISRGISKAQDRHAAAVAFRDSINEYREMKRLQKTSSPEDSPTFYPYQQQFIEFAVSQQVLKFGSFTLKSGRISPYFFNAGLFSSGEALLQLGRFYAEAIVQSGVEFDVLFGPAYKGIPLATAVSMCLASDYDLCKGFAYNRKEAKDHGEGGNLVGTSMTGKKVLLIDDVITAGTAIREAMGFLEQAGAIPVGIVVALDRQEKTNETSTLSAVQEVETAFNIPVISVISLSHLATYLQNNSDASTLEEIKKYRDLYGIS